MSEFRIDYIEATSLENGVNPDPLTIGIQEQLGKVHKTIIKLTAFPITLSDLHVGGGAKIFTFPEGRIMIYGATAKNVVPTTTSIIASTLNASKTLSAGIGTVQTATQDSGTLVTTQQDIVNAFAPVSSATINVAGTGANGKDDGTPQGFDGTATAIALFLNFGVPTATDIDGDATITVNADEITIWWSLIADY